ncbi:MAG TPA: type II CAAX endopeptidase family protein, partial [Streptomyces sp.]|nr:type II CAAX endopeptidase family protein [Streptomyces sp.]
GGPSPWQSAPGGPAPWGPPPWGYLPPTYPPHWLPPGTPAHDEPQPYLLAMRSRTWRWWRPVLGLLMFLLVYLVGALLTLLVGGIGLFLAGGVDLTVEAPDMSGPGFLLLINLVTAVAIPVVWLAWGAAHRMRIGWSSSVLGRLRWRLFPAYVGFALLTIGASIALSLALAVVGGWDVTGPVESYGWLVVVVLLTTPLQSAAEEYLFRGYLSQAIAGWVRDPRAGAISAALVTAALFSLAHLPQDFLMFLQLFLVGLAASAVVWLTGGLEAAIALHAVNNVVIFVLAGAMGEDATAATQSQAAAQGVDVVLVLVALAAFVALVARSRGRLRPEMRTPALDLRPPVPPLPAAAG